MKEIRFDRPFDALDDGYAVRVSKEEEALGVIAGDVVRVEIRTIVPLDETKLYMMRVFRLPR